MFASVVHKCSMCALYLTLLAATKDFQIDAILGSYEAAIEIERENESPLILKKQTPRPKQILEKVDSPLMSVTWRQFIPSIRSRRGGRRGFRYNPPPPDFYARR